MKQSSLQRYNFYGRKHGKKLSKLQKYYITEFLPAIAPIGVSYAENPNREKLSFSNIFGAKEYVGIEYHYQGDIITGKMNTNGLMVVGDNGALMKSADWEVNVAKSKAKYFNKYAYYENFWINNIILINIF